VREFHIFLYFIGMLANTIMNEVLKELMKEPRPHGACKDDYGMPSNHAQSIFFFAAYWSFLFSRHVTLSSALTNRLTAGAWWLVAVAVAYSRVHLGYHSNAQVAVGAGSGVIVALFCALVVFGRHVGPTRWPRERGGRMGPLDFECDDVSGCPSSGCGRLTAVPSERIQ